MVDDTFRDEKFKHVDAEESVTFPVALANNSSVALSRKVDDGVLREGADLIT